MNLISIKKSATVMFALLLMATAAFPTGANAQSVSELQAKINQLLAQVALLQAQLGGVTGTCTMKFNSNLAPGASGPDVLALQKFLNRSADTRVAISGAGSPGLETQYYGPATAAAVSKFQVKYRAEILTPAGLVSPTGFFGPASRAKANALCTVVVPPIVTPGDDDDDDNNSGALKGGEARLEDFQTNEGEDTSVAEGEDNASVMDVEFGVEDGDVEINRVDVAFDHVSGGDEEPWDIFESVSLWVDGDEVASIDVDDDSVWSENEPNSGDYRLRIADIDDFIVREGDTAEFTVAVTVSGNVDDAGAVEWQTFIPDDGIRAIDSEDINHFIGETDETVNFDINEAGAGSELVVRTSSEDPDAQTLQLERETTSGWMNVFAFELDADDSEDDLTIDSIPLTVDVTDSETYNALVRDARLVIDGEEYDDVEVQSGATDTATLVFDTEGLTLDAGESVTVELELEFRALSQADEGTKLQASISSSQVDDIDAEGEEELSATQISGSATGEIHTLRTGGTTNGNVETSATWKENSNATSDDDEGVYTIEFEVSAFNQDVFIKDSAVRGTTTSTGGVNFILEDNSGEVTEGVVDANLDSTADEDDGWFFIPEGSTETFTLTVEYNPEDEGFYRLQLYTINYNDTEADPEVFQRATPESTYRTQYLSI
jgi:peptidoglycan hydrolase-like protein with peptidoglycan-binding domain